MSVLVVTIEAIAVLSPQRAASRSGAIMHMSALPIPERSKAILQRSCKDCHSNETTWPWYSRMQPVAMLIQRDVAEGRKHLDFSAEWPAGVVALSHNQWQEICDAVSNRSMPPRRYLLMHGNARLAADEVSTICDLAESAK